MAWDGPSSHASIASLLESSRSLQPSSSSQPLEAITIINNPVFLDTQHQRRYIASGLAQSGTVSYSRTSDRNPPFAFPGSQPCQTNRTLLDSLDPFRPSSPSSNAATTTSWLLDDCKASQVTIERKHKTLLKPWTTEHPSPTGHPPRLSSFIRLNSHVIEPDTPTLLSLPFLAFPIVHIHTRGTHIHIPCTHLHRTEPSHRRLESTRLIRSLFNCTHPSSYRHAAPTARPTRLLLVQDD